MTLLQMRYILEIDRCGSINKAAQRLFLSQSALSSAIVEVEQELGITVFHRSNRGVSLTEEGRSLVGQIAPIVEQSRKLSRYYTSRRAGDWVQLSVASQRYPFCAKAFVELLRELPESPMQLSLKELDMADVIREVALGESELGVLFISDLTEHAVLRTLEEKQLDFEPLVTLKPHVFLRRGHPLAGERSVSLEQLRPYPHIVFTRSEGDLNFAEEAVAGSGVDFPRMVCVSDRATIYNIMAHTDCVSTGSGVLPPGYADAGLTAIPLAGQRDMRLGYIHRREPLNRLQARFVELLKEITADM
ncbi:MAG: LysR family transcriptional regulator [Oscillospiraceae bacterium]|nr:LysR family transcriptional regulator [Oscillospiraceae bacterium]